VRKKKHHLLEALSSGKIFRKINTRNPKVRKAAPILKVRRIEISAINPPAFDAKKIPRLYMK